VSKPYSILGAALVADGRSLSTEPIGAPRVADPAPRFFIGDDWPFGDGTALLFAEAGEQIAVSQRPPAAWAAERRTRL